MHSGRSMEKSIDEHSPPHTHHTLHGHVMLSCKIACILHEFYYYEVSHHRQYTSWCHCVARVFISVVQAVMICVWLSVTFRHRRNRYKYVSQVHVSGYNCYSVGVVQESMCYVQMFVSMYSFIHDVVGVAQMHCRMLQVYRDTIVSVQVLASFVMYLNFDCEGCLQDWHV